MGNTINAQPDAVMKACGAFKVNLCHLGRSLVSSTRMKVKGSKVTVRLVEKRAAGGNSCDLLSSQEYATLQALSAHAALLLLLSALATTSLHLPLSL